MGAMNKNSPGSVNGMAPNRRQAFIWTITGLIQRFNGPDAFWLFVYVYDICIAVTQVEVTNEYLYIIPML